MRPGESKLIFAVANAVGTVFIDSFQNTQKLAEDAYAAARGKESWEQCVTEEGVTCLKYRLTLDPIQ